MGAREATPHAVRHGRRRLQRRCRDILLTHTHTHTHTRACDRIHSSNSKPRDVDSDRRSSPRQPLRSHGAVALHTTLCAREEPSTTLAKPQHAQIA
jgi:hypothetical protein